MKRWKKFGIAALCALSFWAAYTLTLNWQAEQGPTPAKKITPKEAPRVKFVRTYEGTGAVHEETWDGPRDYARLQNLFPESDGWRYSWQEDGSLTLARTIAGLPPEDAKKRHLGIYENHVAVFIGPPGSDGGLDRVTAIPVDRLPAPIRTQLQGGQMEYMSEEELLLLCENYDEE